MMSKKAAMPMDSPKILMAENVLFFQRFRQAVFI
jgi:hypothetical protein